MTETPDMQPAGSEQIAINGQAYRLTHVGPEIRANFSRWAKQRARAELRKEHAESILTRQEYRDRLDRLEERITAGTYNWGSPLSANDMGTGITALLNDTEGGLELLRLLLEKHHGLMTIGQVVELSKGADQAELTAAIGNCLSAAPNEDAPAQTAGKTTTANGVTAPAA